MKLFVSFLSMIVFFFVGLESGILVQKRNELETAQIASTVVEELKILDTIERVIIAESGGKHQNVWGANGEYGVCQMKRQTFYWLAKKAGLNDPDWKNQIHQIYLLRWAIKNGYASHWSTFSKVRD